MEQRAEVDASISAHSAFLRSSSLVPIVGREQDLQRLRGMLLNRRPRLLTVLGPGGVGKTRLAIEVAQTCADLFPGGVRFIELAALSHGSEVAREILKRIGVVGASKDALSDILGQIGDGAPMLTGVRQLRTRTRSGSAR